MALEFVKQLEESLCCEGRVVGDRERKGSQRSHVDWAWSLVGTNTALGTHLKSIETMRQTFSNFLTALLQAHTPRSTTTTAWRRSRDCI